MGVLAKVLIQDGKLVFVRQGNQLLRIAPNPLIKRSIQQLSSDENAECEQDKHEKLQTKQTNFDDTKQSCNIETTVNE